MVITQQAKFLENNTKGAIVFSPFLICFDLIIVI